MFSTIVVGTDGSPTAQAAVQVAADLAVRYGATLHLVCGYRAATPSVAIMAGAMPAMPAAELTGAVEALLAEAAGVLRSRGVEVETHAVEGQAADAVVGVAETTKADLVVVGNRGMSGARRVLGSVPNTVSHHAACSVLIVATT